MLHFSLKASGRSSRSEVFLIKGFLRICSKFVGEYPCRSAISIKLQSTLRHGCSPENLLHIFKTTFSKNTTGWLRLLLCGYSPDSVQDLISLSIGIDGYIFKRSQENSILCGLNSHIWTYETNDL